jgi:hypothetical protein
MRGNAEGLLFGRGKAGAGSSKGPSVICAAAALARGARSTKSRRTTCLARLKLWSRAGNVLV